jgi:hypothetical protein
MSYGVLLKNNNTNQSILDDNILFYPTARAGVSTSDPYYFETFNFTANSMTVNFSQFANLISLTNASNYSNINFDLNKQGFFCAGYNLSSPTLIEICAIDGYETGIGQTVFASSADVGSKILHNLSDPNNIYTITNSSFGVQTSYFGNSLNFARSGVVSDVQNFLYAKYEHDNIIKYFLAIPRLVGAKVNTPSNFYWSEIPGETFNFNIEYYLTILTSGFDGSSIVLSSLKGILPKKGASILVNNISFNDILSGVYTIYNITDKVYLTKNTVAFNFPGQTFNIKTDLDLSGTTTNFSSCYFVSYDYGYPAESFTKNLRLVKFSNLAQGYSTTYPAMYQDQYSSSSLVLNLNTKSSLVKQSDGFVLGVAVSNWFNDSLLFGVGLNYVIKEGF